MNETAGRLAGLENYGHGAPDMAAGCPALEKRGT